MANSRSVSTVLLTGYTTSSNLKKFGTFKFGSTKFGTTTYNGGVKPLQISTREV